MARRLRLHSQLCSVMETMARSALGQISNLVDEDSAELQLEVSRLLFANSALAEKVNRLESELCTVRSDTPNSCKSSRTVGVQTVRHSEGEPQESGCPTIEGIFGKDWCMSLWKDPYHLDTVTDPPQTCDKSVGTISGQITKSEDSVEGAVSSCQQETLSTEAEHEESTAVEPEPLSLGYAADGGTCTLSIDREGEPVESAAVIEKPSISNNDTRAAFSTYVIPIEDDDDDVEFVQESQQEPLPMNAAASGPGNNKLQIIPTDNTENSKVVEKDSQENLTVLNVATVGAPNKQKFTCRICSGTFYHKGTLTTHMKSHKSNFCSICKQHFHHKTKFKSHTCVPPLSSKTVGNSCHLCGKSFRNPSALRIHYVVHTGEKPHTCSFCGKGFSQKGNLKSHLRLHSGETQFRCGKCGKTFTQKASLNDHIMEHENPKVVGDTSVA
ncbi:zinc finger and SCAN domain-containing protein 21-like isoform X1 [Platichthys flesus]|uniref:zinc finger and SCAN domain-containing protein 21-like isoform X1 n=1 Tax=Platichthys flesus TaxID=8260 RepID=UPI002DB9F4D0|nr:zinc finger and SCAN domain-containing protein 21-like isoform X1 [Platichthys flesus]